MYFLKLLYSRAVFPVFLDSYTFVEKNNSIFSPIVRNNTF